LESLKLGRFQQASNQALKQKQPLLATVIQKVFLSGLSNQEINQYKSEYLQSLILNWRSSKTDRHVDIDTLQCYTLVAGFPQFETSDRTVIDNCKSLDWLSLLALQFWFFSEADDEIIQVLEKFKELREKLNLDFATPVQPWDQNNNDTKLENFARKNPCYHLLEFFCDPNVVSIANVVDPLNFSDNQLKVEESWHAWRALAQTEELNSLLTKENENYINAASTRLHTAYSEVLLQEGKIHEAIQVVQHIKNESVRSSRIKQILMDKWSDLSGHVREGIADELGLKKSMVQEIEVIKNRSRKSESVGSTNKDIMENMKKVLLAEVPDLIGEDYLVPYLINSLLNETESGDFKGLHKILSQVLNKDVFGELVYTYLDVYTEMSQIHRLEKKLKLHLMDDDSSKPDYENIERISYPVERLENLKSKCNWLIDNMPKIMQTATQNNSADRTEMAFLRHEFSKNVVEFLKTLVKQLDLGFDEARWNELHRALGLEQPNL